MRFVTPPRAYFDDLLLPGRGALTAGGAGGPGGLLERLKGVQLASTEPWVPRKALNVLGPARLPLCFEPVMQAATGA
ncbi:hypothetical protein ACLESD_21760 [Pyxidicoccus sp. 3LFB2]